MRRPPWSIMSLRRFAINMNRVLKSITASLATIMAATINGVVTVITATMTVITIMAIMAIVNPMASRLLF
jgi:tRNA threonylcarbamoyladenosine modification (KEOPS) complex  Pcc1 subunit